jgi:hypothetical protein
MVTQNLFNDVRIQLLMGATDLTVGSTVSDTTDLTVNTTLDMAGYEGVMFLAFPSQVTVAAGTIGLIPKFGSSSGTLTLAATSFWGGTSTIGGTTLLGQGYIALDIVKPIQRYVGVRLHRAIQNANAVVVAVQYGKKLLQPTTSSTGAGSNWVMAGSTNSSGGGALYMCMNTTQFGFPTFAGTTA